MNVTNVYIADDHKLLVEGLQELISTAGFAVAGISHDGCSAVREILLARPAVVLMDLDLPEMNGMEATRQIRKEWPEARIIIITMHLEKSLIEKAIKLGAYGYLPKNVSRNEFIHAITEVAAGNCYFSPDITKSLALGQSARISNQPDLILQASSLSEREEEVLKAVAEGYSNREIAEKLNLSAHTIDSHRKNIMRKLGVANTAGLIRFALKAGIVN